MPSQTRWLDDEEQELWRLLLGAVRKINRGMDETLKAGGEVSASEFAVLVALSEAPEQHLRLHELCTQLEWDRSRASHQVTRMEKRGLLYKEPDAVDARGINVCVTHVGLEHLRRAAPEHVESVRRMVFDHLQPEDVPALRRFFNGVLQAKNLPGYEGYVPDSLLHGRD
ncbi:MULTISPECIES: MarR family winged helix-turn-helix transcriptional regulator [Corynebacterium]|uniref:MarR family winged helix-turn-helix transcriptional regulator n=1 Tax=Corynebacterium kefirresidentii TaxID=1979527 RepID=A0ABT8Q4N1_9CORY|nr:MULTISPECIES: MarR family winged helix-turn-helix transcriptional regulator [Corynebacterium]MCG7241253.1 MarR family winged helix-turn-helix transcriptional regulator [Corynebacterium kefirresidentii]MCG7283735.1 MarR family winged helix-turn-helix transcriptional regulator [Corynebacterium kefirresidentii]MDK8586070.1 MarR family winged helix-turn-helix transcriptional regulator [Corynebacterium kefirresidentii]MDN8620310.1 MarR family winged helix-turn-helix transcriptional regulator [Cor